MREKENGQGQDVFKRRQASLLLFTFSDILFFQFAMFLFLFFEIGDGEIVLLFFSRLFILY